MANFAFNVSPQGVNALTATTGQLTLNTKYPFHKLDVTKSVSFQNIELSFTRDTPNPIGVLFTPLALSYSRTVVYQFPHGYNYVPSTWAFTLNNYQSPNGNEAPAYNSGNMPLLGILATDPNGGSSQATLWISADTTNVYLTVIKAVLMDFFGNYPPTSTLVNLTGFTANIRLYVFAESLVTPDIGT